VEKKDRSRESFSRGEAKKTFKTPLGLLNTYTERVITKGRSGARTPESQSRSSTCLRAGKDRSFIPKRKVLRGGSNRAMKEEKPPVGFGSSKREFGEDSKPN